MSIRQLVSSLPFQIIFLVIVSLLYLSQGITEPFDGEHDFNGVEYGIFARNHLEHGFGITKLGSLYTTGRTVPLETAKKGGYNTHHLVLLPLLISLSYFLFGISEWSTRLVSVLASTSGIVGLYFIGRSIGNRTAGFFAALFAVFTPMLAFYGKLPAHEPLLFALGIWSTYFYLEWLKKKEGKKFYVLLFLTFIIGISGWPGYCWIGGIVVHHLVWYKRCFDKRIFFLALLLTATFILHLIHVRILTGNFLGGGLKDVFFLRLNQSENSTAISFSTSMYVTHQLRVISKLLTPIIGVGLLGWIASVSTRIIEKNEAKEELKAVTALLFGGVAYSLVFTQAVILHDYLNIYYIPPLTLASGLVVDYFLRKITSEKALLRFAVPTLIILIEIRLGESALNRLVHTRPDVRNLPVGRALAKHTKYGDTIMILSPELMGGADKYVMFYANRDVYFDSFSYDDIAQNPQKYRDQFDYALIYKHNVPSRPTETFMLENFEYEVIGDIKLFNLSKLKKPQVGITGETALQ